MNFWANPYAWEILKKIGIPDHLTCLLRNLYTGQEATVRTGHGTTAWFQIEKGVHQGCILSSCLFNLHAEYIMCNARLQQYLNRELPDVQAGFRKGRGIRDQIANIVGSSKNEESSRKTSISSLLTMPKPLTVWITINCGKFLKRWEYQTSWPASWEVSVYRSRSNG